MGRSSLGAWSRWDPSVERAQLNAQGSHALVDPGFARGRPGHGELLASVRESGTQTRHGS